VAPAAKEPPGPAPRPEVEYVTVRAPRSPATLELRGAVVPVRSATLAAPTAGQVAWLAEEGAQLAAGEEVALLEATGLAAEVDLAEASLDAAERRATSARTAAEQAAGDAGLAVATLEQTLRAAEAERDRRQAALEGAAVQATAEPARLRAELAAAEARLRLLRAPERNERIRQAEAELAAVQAETKVARYELKQATTLRVRGLASPSEVASARLNVERSRANETKLQEQLKLLRAGNHPAAIAEGEQQVEAALAMLRGADGLAEQVAERRAELAGAAAEVAKARENLDNARQNRLPITRAQQEAAAAAAEVHRWQVALAEARRRREQATVTSPFAGQVVRRRARPGETVAVGTPLLDLVDPGGLRFEASLPAAAAGGLRRGDLVWVRLAADAGEPRPGRVAELVLSPDPANAATLVKIDLPAGAGLRPGMAGAAQVAVVDRPRLLLPRAALRRHFPAENRAEVLVLTGGEARPGGWAGAQLDTREVRLAPLAGGEGSLEVQQGLAEGERVITASPGALPPGVPVDGREVTLG
jgi:RND family efflux transporter MFP subunit